MRSALLRLGIAAAGLPLLAAPALADSVEDFYKGRTVTLNVSAGAGGGYDAYARTVGRHIGKFIPGNPTIVVQNRPGAGGLVMANYFYNAAPQDGSVFGAIHRNMPTDPLIGDKGKKIKYVANKFHWLGSTNSEVSICASRADSPVKTFQDAIDHELILGAEPNTDIEQFPIVMNNLIGTKFKIVTGYPSGTGVNLAMERGEVQGRCGWSWSSFKSQKMKWVKDGRAYLFVQISLKKHPDLPDVPLVMDYVKDKKAVQALRLIFSRQEFGRPYFAPPGVPKDRVAALRAAFWKTMTDKGFVADIEKQKLELDPMKGEDLQAMIEELYETPKDVVEAAIRATHPQKKLAKAKIEMVTQKGPVLEVLKGGRTIVFEHHGQKMKAGISGSGTKVMVDGRKAKRKAIKVGMTCSVTYPGPGQRAKSVECAM